MTKSQTWLYHDACYMLVDRAIRAKPVNYSYYLEFGFGLDTGQVRTDIETDITSGLYSKLCSKDEQITLEEYFSRGVKYYKSLQPTKELIDD